MMTISVKFANISAEELQTILGHYNTNKPSDFMALEELDRCEGGFQIALTEPEMELMKKSSGIYHAYDHNNQVKQVRWNRRKLDSFNFIGFNQEETILLYQALIHVFGESFVVLNDY